MGDLLLVGPDDFEFAAKLRDFDLSVGLELCLGLLVFALLETQLLMMFIDHSSFGSRLLHLSGSLFICRRCDLTSIVSE